LPTGRVTFSGSRRLFELLGQQRHKRRFPDENQHSVVEYLLYVGIQAEAGQQQEGFCPRIARVGRDSCALSDLTYAHTLGQRNHLQDKSPAL